MVKIGIFIAVLALAGRTQGMMLAAQSLGFTLEEAVQSDAKFEACFQAYLKMFNKSYKNEAELRRHALTLRDNILHFIESNKQTKQFKLGIGPFSDMSWEEFKSTTLMKVDGLEYIRKLRPRRIPSYMRVVQKVFRYTKKSFRPRHTRSHRRSSFGSTRHFIRSRRFSPLRRRSWLRVERHSRRAPQPQARSSFIIDVFAPRHKRQLRVCRRRPTSTRRVIYRHQVYHSRRQPIKCRSHSHVRPRSRKPTRISKKNLLIGSSRHLIDDYYGYSNSFSAPSEEDNINALPKKVDWSNYAQKVQNQLSCAACYAFSSIGAFEIAYKMVSGRNMKFSEQQIIDCSDNQGCTGGTPGKVYDYINSKGICWQYNYPYYGDFDKCMKTRGDINSIKISYSYVDAGIVSLIKAISKGPVVVLHAVAKSFKDYIGGIYNNKECTGDLKHSSVAVGYDISDQYNMYVLFRNAWGPFWGEKGYYKMGINRLNNMAPSTCDVAAHTANVAIEIIHV